MSFTALESEYLGLVLNRPVLEDDMLTFLEIGE